MSLVLKCIQFMVEKGAAELRLIDGKPPAVKVGESFKALQAPAVTLPDLADFIESQLGGSAQSLQEEGIEEYSFGSQSSPMRIIKRRANGIVSLQILASANAGAAEAPPAQPAAAEEEGAQRPQPVTPARVEARGPEPEINRLFRKMVEMGASDLHLSSNAPPYVRVDGQMLPLPEAVLTDPKLWELLKGITPAKNQKHFEENWDTDFAYEIKGLVRFRCNLFHDRFGRGAVFRQIPTKVLTCDDLGLSKEIQRICFLSKGLVLVTGPTGSGKSTTLAALVDHVNKNRTDHIITIEDPIEFVHENQKCLINQREVGEHTKGFKNALRAALREDPDIVLVGEMRDLETISIAIETAETGHLVFGTLHTTTAVSTVDRIIDQFPSDQQEQIRVMLSESLRAVISQTLCRKIKGGRVAALEVMLYNRAIANLIREGKTYQIPSVLQTCKKEGMVGLNDALIDLFNRKIISADEAYTKAVDKDTMRPLLEGKGLTIK